MEDDREGERSARKVRRAAERESHGDGLQRRVADRESASASHVLTRRELAKGHPPPAAKRR